MYILPICILSILYFTLILSYYEYCNIVWVSDYSTTFMKYICCKNEPFVSLTKLSDVTTPPYYLEEIDNLIYLISIKFEWYASCINLAANVFQIILPCSFKLLNKYIIKTLVVRVIFISFLIILKCAHSVLEFNIHFYEIH